jgi:hypothetical protein
LNLRPFHLAGDLRETYTTLPRYLWHAAVTTAWAHVANLERLSRISPIFDSRRLGVILAVLGYCAGLYSDPAPTAFNVFEFFFGMFFGVVTAYWIVALPSRSLWLSIVFFTAIPLQLFLVLLNAFPGRFPNQGFQEWGISITFTAVMLSIILRSRFPSEEHH